MEVEMKAKVTLEQMAKFLVKYLSDKNSTDVDLIIKKDRYFKHKDIKGRPDNQIRIRENFKLITLNKESGPVFVIPLRRIETDLNDEESIKEMFEVFFDWDHNWFDIKEDRPWDYHAELTIKNKHTYKNGTEVNTEHEEEFSNKQIELFEILLSSIECIEYFSKEKRSIGWYILKMLPSCALIKLHCELVMVGGKGPYLETEIVINDPDKANEAAEEIKTFYKENFGITEFDARSWAEIIEA